MARKKTKKEKIKTARRRAENTAETKNVGKALYSIDDSMLKDEKSVGKKGVKKSAGVKMSSLFNFDPKLLVSDIRKTMFLSLLMFCLEIGLYFYLR